MPTVASWLVTPPALDYRNVPDKGRWRVARWRMSRLVMDIRKGRNLGQIAAMMVNINVLTLTGLVHQSG